MPAAARSPRLPRAPRISDAERRAQLLAYGRVHFAAHAFDAMSVQEIARRAGVSKALLYHHFAGRRGFYLATVEDVVDQLLAALQAEGPPVDPSRSLQRLIERFVAYVEENGAIYQALVRGGLGADPEVAAQLDRVRGFAIEAVGAPFGLGVDPLQRIQLAAWVAWIETATSLWLDQRDTIDTPRFIATVVERLSRGVAELLAAPSGASA